MSTLLDILLITRTHADVMLRMSTLVCMARICMCGSATVVIAGELCMHGCNNDV